MVLLTEGGTRFSWLEYQALMLCLAAIMCLVLGAVEITMSRFQALPVLFPSMYSVRDRRCYVFDLDITDGRHGKVMRRMSKHVLRITILLILSYLWQSCVLRADQTIGKNFPTESCEAGFDCFASEVHVLTIIKRQYSAVDCSGERSNFETEQVISCVRFVEPSASEWLMHLAIANSVAQLNFKCFELGVWLAGRSRNVRHLLVLLFTTSAVGVLAIFFLGVTYSFVSSWLSFVMVLSVPAWFYLVLCSGHSFKSVWEQTEKRFQQSIESNLNAAFQDIEDVLQKHPIDDGELECVSPDDPKEGSRRDSQGAQRLSVMRQRTKRIIDSMRGIIRVSTGISTSTTSTTEYKGGMSMSTASPSNSGRAGAPTNRIAAGVSSDDEAGRGGDVSSIVPPMEADLQSREHTA